jgi:hypothetical protein
VTAIRTVCVARAPHMLQIRGRVPSARPIRGDTDDSRLEGGPPFAEVTGNAPT